MIRRAIGRSVCVLMPCVAAIASPPRPLDFEEAVRMSDRIVVGSLRGAGAGSARLPNGEELALGIKDPETGLVFTPYRIHVSECLFDKDASCRPGDSEFLLPGGTVYEAVRGERRLRTWEVAGAAGAPLPPAGDDVLLFMTKRNGRYLPLNDKAARVRVDRSSGAAAVMLRFASPRFLSADGREAARIRLAGGHPATTPPVFVESVGLDRLKTLILLAREVPKPTSGTGHAVPPPADIRAARVVRQRRFRLRAGQVPKRRRSSLGLGDHRGPAHRADGGRRPRRP